MSQKHQIYILVGGFLIAASAAAYFAYQNYTIKTQLAAWYKNQDATKANLPVEIAEMLNKALAA